MDNMYITDNKKELSEFLIDYATCDDAQEKKWFKEVIEEEVYYIDEFILHTNDGGLDVSEDRTETICHIADADTDSIMALAEAIKNADYVEIMFDVRRMQEDAETAMDDYATYRSMVYAGLSSSF